MILRRFSLFIASLLSLHGGVRGAPYSPEEIRIDLKFLYETLKVSHYDLFAHTSKEVYDKEFQRLYDAIDRPLDDLGAYRMLQPFAELCGMSHCNIGLPFDKTYVPFVTNGGTAIPFDVTFVGEAAVIWHNYSSKAEVAPGDTILAIGGKPIGAVLEGIYRLVSGDSPYMKRTNIELTAFPRLYWLAYGEAKKYALTLRKANGSTLELEVDAVPALTLEQKAAANKPVTHSGRESRFLGDVAYLRPGVFLNQQSAATLADQRALDKGEFLQFLAAAFHDIAEKKSRSLIIDLRGNPGGDNSFSDPFIAYFAERAFRFCSSFDVRTSERTKDAWAGIHDEKLSSLKKEILSHENGERFKVDIPHFEPNDKSKRFSGRVYALVDRFTYSNAAVTAAIIQDYKFGVIVGQTTADSPTTYGAAHSFKLPNTHLTVMYPKAFMVRPSGEASFQGIRPEHEVADDLFTDEDEALKQALALAQAHRR